MNHILADIYLFPFSYVISNIIQPSFILLTWVHDYFEVFQFKTAPFIGAHISEKSGYLCVR